MMESLARRSVLELEYLTMTTKRFAHRGVLEPGRLMMTMKRFASQSVLELGWLFLRAAECACDVQNVFT